MSINTTTSKKSRTTTSKTPVKSASKKKSKLNPGQLLTGMNSVFRVPATGGYHGGRVTGEAIAIALLKELRDTDSDGAFMRLKDISRALENRLEREGGQTMRALPIAKWSNGYESAYGQYYGFMEAMGGWIASAAKMFGSNLDAFSDDELLDKAKAGIDFDESIRMRAYIDNRKEDAE